MSELTYSEQELKRLAGYFAVHYDDFLSMLEKVGEIVHKVEKLETMASQGELEKLTSSEERTIRTIVKKIERDVAGQRASQGFYLGSNIPATAFTDALCLFSFYYLKCCPHGVEFHVRNKAYFRYTDEGKTDKRENWNVSLEKQTSNILSMLNGAFGER